MRNVGGILCDLAGFKSRLIAGRMEVDVDMREYGRSMAVGAAFDIDVSRNKFEMEKYSVPATVQISLRWPNYTNHMCSSLRFTKKVRTATCMFHRKKQLFPNGNIFCCMSLRRPMLPPASKA